VLSRCTGVIAALLLDAPLSPLVSPPHLFFSLFLSSPQVCLYPQRYILCVCIRISDPQNYLPAWQSPATTGTGPRDHHTQQQSPQSPAITGASRHSRSPQATAITVTITSDHRRNHRNRQRSEGVKLIAAEAVG